MTDTAIETATELLTSILDETDDPDISYKLRTALQLLEVHEDRLTRLDAVADDHEELAERLQDLGYLD